MDEKPKQPQKPEKPDIRLEQESVGLTIINALVIIIVVGLFIFLLY